MISHPRHALVLLAAGLLGVLLPAGLRAEPYPDRFVWLFGWNLNKDSDVAAIHDVLETAAQHGLNGVVLSAGLDGLSRQSPDYFRRLEQVQADCARLKLELIPSGFSVGYGGAALGANRMLAEGVPVQDAPMLVAQGEARLVPDPAVRIVNGDFERFKNQRFEGFELQDQPGQISFVDTEVKHGGSASIRLENFTANQYGHGRVMQKVKVQPHRCYRVRLWVKTEDLAPVTGFQISVYGQNRQIAPRTFRLPATGDWRQLVFVFNSLEYDAVNLYTGTWGGKAGKLWLDDWSIEEVGPLNVLRRPGTPVTVKSEDGATTYVEGQDYAPLEDPKFSFGNVDRDAPPLRLPPAPGGRIRDGQPLRVSWYHPMTIHDGQITMCMAEPQLYEIYDREAKVLAERLHPKRVLLNMDEIRMGGTCAACRGRDMGELLGECVTKQVQILRKYLPGVQVYIWSDMFDPNHNAHGDYYLVQGSFAGSWKHVPKDLVMAVWGSEPREKNLRFFAGEGFATLGACYYDADDLKDVQGWIQVGKGIPGAGLRGLMYTPWQRKYQLLGDFGDLLRAGR